LLEAKYQTFSKMISSNDSPLFFIGDSFKRRCSNLFLICLNFLKINFPTTKCLLIKPESNTSTLIFSGIKVINKNLILKSSSICYYNLDFNQKLKKILDIDYYQNKKVETLF